MEDLDRPSRSDFYLMQLTREVRLFRAMFSERVEVPDVNAFKIPFGKEAQEALNPKLTDEESALQAKSHWRAMLGKPIKST